MPQLLDSSSNNNIIKLRTHEGDRFQNIISAWKARGLTAVSDFLLTKSRKSKRTAITFSYGLEHLNRFVEHDYKADIGSILPQILKKKLDVYKLLDEFVSYLQHDSTNGDKLSPASLHSYMNAARSYFQYHDIEISPSKFRYKVSLPTVYHEDEQPIDATDIKNILNHCNNRRLKAYLLVLASGGMRAIEALAIRERDIDFSGIDFTDPNDTGSPAVVRVRKEYAKTRTERRIFISNESARYLKQWIEWKYRDRTKERKYYALKNRARSDNDLVFSTINATEPHGIYFKILEEFQKVLEAAGLATRKEEGVYKRRKITFHSFRRFVRTTIANQTGNTDYGEWFLGHKKSVYYTNKPEQLKRIYAEHCMRYLTFLDYPTIEATGRSYEARLQQKDQEIEGLKQQIHLLQQRDSMNTDSLASLADTVNQLKADMDKLKSK